MTIHHTSATWKVAITFLVFIFLMLSASIFTHAYFSGDDDTGDNDFSSGSVDISVSDTPDPFNPSLGEINIITINNIGTDPCVASLSIENTGLSWGLGSLVAGDSIQTLWNGRDEAGNIVPPGVYNYTAACEQEQSVLSGFDKIASFVISTANAYFSDTVTGTITVLGEESQEPKTIYVDDDFTDDLINHKWDTIQEGIDDANEGDTVVVKDGTYTENIDVNKSHLTIKSENGADATIIQSANSANWNDYVFEVTFDDVSISGFTITGGSNAGVYLNSANYCNIFNNNLSKNNHGIELRFSSNNKINNNDISWSCTCGIVMVESSNNDITGNDISFGNMPDVQLSSSNYNNISDNSIGIGNIGIYWSIGLYNSSNNNINGNKIENGIALSGSSKNNINGNKIENGIALMYSSNNNINTNNTSSIYLGESSNNSVYLNNITKGFFSYSNNIWNSTEPIAYTYNGNTYTNYLGNYWSDYAGNDVSPKDGIGDIPYNIDSDQDNYPLMQPFENYLDGGIPFEPFYVKVQNTGSSSSLAIRNLPSTTDSESKVLKRVLDGWVLQVIEDENGEWESNDTDNNIWWHIKEAEFEKNPATGWVAKEYEKKEYVKEVLLNNLIPDSMSNHLKYEEKINSAIKWAEDRKDDYELAENGDVFWEDSDYCAEYNNNRCYWKENDMTFCLRFVKEAFNFPFPSDAWRSAKKLREYFSNQKEFYKIDNENGVDTSWNPPKGALVFFDYSINGHIGVYKGNGKVIHLWGGGIPTETNIESISSLYPYLGWALPEELFKSYTFTENDFVGFDEGRYLRSKRLVVDDIFLVELKIGDYVKIIPNVDNGISYEGYYWWKAKTNKKNEEGEYIEGWFAEVSTRDGRIIKCPEELDENGWCTKDTVNAIKLNSPGDLQVYDLQGRVSGLVNGEIIENIPNSIYDEENHTVVIFFASPDSYFYKVVGTGDGTYGLIISSMIGGEEIIFNATNIPTTPGQVHEFTVDWDKLSQGEKGVIMQIDQDGDGEFEQTVTADSELTFDEFILQTETVVDFVPDTLNLENNGKFMTAYIEFPEGYDVTKIDVSSIMLNNLISVLLEPTEIGDYDNDGIPDLMVKFDRQKVEESLEIGENVEMMITGKLFYNEGDNEGYIDFKGSDTIRVINPSKDKE